MKRHVYLVQNLPIKKTLRRAQLVLLAAVLVGTSLIAVAATQAITRPRSQSSGSASQGSVSTYPVRAKFGGWTIGSDGLGSIGWLLPARALISTSYMVDKTFSTGFISGQLSIIPYQIPIGTELHLGFYVNGQLSGTYDYVFSSSDFPLGGASIVGSSSGGVANFTRSSAAFSAARTPLGTALTVNSSTVLTLTVWTSNSIWAHVEPSSPVHSFETLGMTTYTPPLNIIPQTGIISPHTLSVVFEADV